MKNMNVFKKMTLLLLLCLVVFAPRAYSQVDLKKVAQSTMEFLTVGTSPRACALGEAFTALGSGSEALFYNPAGIADAKSTGEFTVNYTQWIADIKYLSGSGIYNLGSLGTIGVSFLNVDYGTINATSISATLNDPLGYVDHGKMNNVGSYAIGLAYGKSVTDRFAFGGQVKYVGQNLGENYNLDGSLWKQNTARKLAYDIGVRYKTNFKTITFAMALRNFATNVKHEYLDEQLPLTFTMGATMNFLSLFDAELQAKHELNLTCDYYHSNDYTERFNLGTEYVFMDMLALRAGYQTNRDLASWSAGVGFKQNVEGYNVGVDYSYSRFEYFDKVSRISVIIGF